MRTVTNADLAGASEITQSEAYDLLALGGTEIANRPTRAVDELRELLMTDTSDMLSRMADRLLRQERMIVEERARATRLELELASLRATSYPVPA